MNGHNANTTAKPLSTFKTGVINFLLLASFITLAACGGGADTTPNPQQSNLNSISVDIYDGEPERDDLVRSYKTTVFDGLRLTDRCGACHTSTSSSAREPYFVQRNDVNIAYDWAVGNMGSAPLIDLADPANSRLVTKVGSGPNGHNCWLENKEACVFYITNRIQNMVSTQAGNADREIPLTPPEDHEIEVFKSWPEDAPSGFGTLHTILRNNCASCHVPGAPVQQGAPFFAVDDAEVAYDELRVNGKVVLGDTDETRSQSRIVVRPRDEDHVCWDTDSDGDLDCPENAQAILNAITTMVNSIPDPTAGGADILANLTTSKALTIADAILATGGNRYEAAQIALYEFKTGAGRDIVDVSAASPGVDLRLFGTEGIDYRWLGNFGIEFLGPNGKAVANPATVRKFYDQIAPANAYSIEAWVIPNNVVQENSAIISYSAGSENRNFGLEQNMYNYLLYNRYTPSGGNANINGQTAVATPDADEIAQAALQHVVVTYSSANGRRIYVNGRLINNVTDDQPTGGNLSEWDPSYQFILGNSDSNDRPWRGAFRMVAVHNAELTLTQIEQNFDVGVGEKYFMLFPLREKDPDPTDAITTEPPLAGVPASCHVKFEFMEFDAFSYLFNQPELICLDSAETPAGIHVKSMWLGINGSFPNAGQAYQVMDVNASGSPLPVDAATNSVRLSDIGTTVELKNGALGSNTLPPDQFFLAFEVIGGATTDPANLPDPAAALPAISDPDDPAPSPDIGLRTFDEINVSMSEMTGIAATNSAVQAVFNQYIQQLPSAPTIDAFLSSHQMAIAQLALQYCNQMVQADIGAGSASNGLFGGTFNYGTAISSAERTEVVNKFMEMFMSYDTTATPTTLTTQPTIADVTNYLAASGNVTLSDDRPFTAPTQFTSLIETLSGRGTSTDKIVTATCGAILGSAVTTVH